VSNKSDWVVIETVHGELAANVLKSILESEGVPALLQSRGGTVYAFSVGKLGEVKVMVPKAFEEKARELIKPEEPAPDESNKET
jgi:hypothetical protein